MNAGKILLGLAIAGGVGYGAYYLIQRQKKNNLIDEIMAVGRAGLPGFDASRSVLEKMTIRELEMTLDEIYYNIEFPAT